jgi:hypothetical protein
MSWRIATFWPVGELVLIIDRTVPVQVTIELVVPVSLQLKRAVTPVPNS